MSYNTLKALVNAKVYENTEQRITGGDMNDVLQSAIASLGAHYQMGGLVSPTDQITVRDEPVVFLATTPGTYTYFGGLVVADGEVALLVWSGTAWSKQTPDISTRTELNQLGQEVKQIIGGSFTPALSIERGGISTTNGEDQVVNNRLRTSNNIQADSFDIIASNGKFIIYGYDTNGVFKGASGWLTGTQNNISIANATKYRFSFAYTNDAVILAENFISLGITINATLLGKDVKVIPQSHFTSSEKQIARSNIGAMAESKEAELKQYADEVSHDFFAFSITGKGSDSVSYQLRLLPGHQYRLSFLDNAWNYSGSGNKFVIKWSTGTNYVVYDAGAAIPKDIEFVIPDNVFYQTVIIRANSDVTVFFSIVDITDVKTKIIAGIKPYATFTQIDGGWRVTINSSTILYNYMEGSGNQYSPSSETFDFTNSDKILVFDIDSRVVTTAIGTTPNKVLLLDYRSGLKTFVGGLVYPYFIESTRSNLQYFAVVTNLKVNENNAVSWDSLTVYDKNKNALTFSSGLYNLTSSSSYLVIRNGAISVRTLSNLNVNDVVLLQLQNGILCNGLLYPYVINQKINSYYSNVYELNINRFGDQIKNIVWTPKANVRSNEGMNEAGVPVVGVPYSSVKEYRKFVGIDVSLHTFMTAVNNIHSLMYTEQVGEDNSQSAYGRVYKGVNSTCYFGSVCSVFVSTSIGSDVEYSSWEFQTFPEFFIINEQDEQNLMIGDIISEPGHCAIITRIYRKYSGEITDIEVSEHNAPVQTTTYRVAALKSRRLRTGGVYCRMKNISDVNKYIPYKPSPFVLAPGEYLYKGGDLVYIDGDSSRVFYRCNEQHTSETFRPSQWSAIPEFVEGSVVYVNDYRQYGEKLYRCKETHTPTTWDLSKWEYVPGVCEWASYPYTYNDDIVTFAGDRAAFKTNDLIYINYNKGDYSALQLYKDGTLIQTLSLTEGYQMDVSSYCSTPGMYKARLTNGTDYSRYTYFEVIDTTCRASVSNAGIVTIEYSSNNGEPLEAQIIEESGFPVCHYSLVEYNGSIKFNPSASLYRQRFVNYERFDGYSETIYARVLFKGEYGNVVSEMIELGIMDAITGNLVMPNTSQSLGELTGSSNIILAEGTENKRYDFSFKANSATVNFMSTTGEITWQSSAPILQNGKTYVVSVINGFAKYDEFNH